MKSFTAHKTPRVLLVDDEEGLHVWIPRWAERMGIDLEFVCASDAQAGIDRLNERCFDCAVVDVMLPGVMGVELGEELRKHDPHIPLVYFTNLDTDTVKQEAAKHNAYYLYKGAYIGSDDGMGDLIRIIERLASLNPCLSGGVRVDGNGFQRKLSKTPIALGEPFDLIMRHSRARMATA